MPKNHDMQWLRTLHNRRSVRKEYPRKAFVRMRSSGFWQKDNPDEEKRNMRKPSEKTSGHDARTWMDARVYRGIRKVAMVQLWHETAMAGGLESAKGTHRNNGNPDAAMVF